MPRNLDTHHRLHITNAATYLSRPDCKIMCGPIRDSNLIMNQWTQQQSTAPSFPNLNNVQYLLARGQDAPLLPSNLGALTVGQILQVMKGSQAWERPASCTAVPHFPATIPSSSVSSSLVGGPIVQPANKRKLEDCADLVPEAKRPHLSEPSTSAPSEKENSNLVKTLTKERDELSEALNASLQLVNRLRAVITKLKKGDAKSADEEETDDGSRSHQRYWSNDEHQRFLEGVTKYGRKSLKAIADHVGTRTATQVRTHSQKYFLKLARQPCTSDDCTGDELCGHTESQCSHSPSC